VACLTIGNASESNGKIDFSQRKSQLAALGPEPEKPLEPLLMSGDLTLEGLAKAWPNLPPALGNFSADGHAMNDDNRLRSAAILSELWDGKPIRRIRARDGVSILHGRRLAMHLMVQPNAAGVFMLNPVLRDQGLLSRVLVASVASKAGARLYREPDAKDDAAIRAYGARLLSILETSPPVEPGTRNVLAPRELPFSADAKAAWIMFHDHVESQCSEGGELADIRDFAAKSAEHAARIAGVLTLVEDLKANEIGLEAMACAIPLADWYVSEARRLQQAGRADLRLLRAKALLDWLQSRPGCQATVREIMQFGPNATRDKAAAEEALENSLPARLDNRSHKKARRPGSGGA
jgi:hypothetical protein